MRGTVRARRRRAARPTTSFNFVVSPADAGARAVVDRGGRRRRSLPDARARRSATRRGSTSITRQPDTLSDDDLRRASVVVLNDVAVPAALGAAARALRRGRRRPVRRRRSAGHVAAGRRRAAGVARRARRSHARRRGPRRRARVRPPGLRAVPRAAQRRLLVGARLWLSHGDRRPPDAQVLARFDAGAPALVERQVGSGRVLLWASTLDLSWSDLPLKPVFLPFVHRACAPRGYTEPRRG